MSHFKKFNEFNIEENVVTDFFVLDETINEGFISGLISMFKKIVNMFKDPKILGKSVDAVNKELGEKSAKMVPKDVKVNNTVFVLFGDTNDKTTQFNVSLTKLADLPDNSGLFQISGTSSPTMLKALTGSSDINDLTANSVMAIITSFGLEREKPARMRILKNIVPGGKDYASKTMVMGIVPAELVQQTMNK